MPAAWLRIVQIRGFGAADTANSIRAWPRDQEAPPAGRLLGGIVDDDIRALVPTLLDGGADALTVGLSVVDEAATQAGLVCGGRLELLAQRLDSVPTQLWDAMRAGRPATVVTVCSGPAAGATAVVDDTGSFGEERLVELGIGEVVAPHPRPVGANARRPGGRSRPTANGCSSRSLLPTLQLLDVGGGELSDALVAQAGLVGWGPAVVDDRDEAVRSAERLGSNDALVVLSHHAEIDTPVLSLALRRGVGFVGALGSRRTQRNRAARLLAHGVSPELIADIHGPVGLDLGAASPAETAVAIVAEILACRSARSGGVIPP